jgi:hypothetical protein
MDKLTQYYVKTNGKINKKKTKKLQEMNDVFKNTMYSEGYPGPIRRTMMQGVNNLISAFRDEDSARAMRHARKAAKIKRSRK